MCRSPMKVTLPEGDPRTVKRFTLVIDENPAPLAGIFDIGPSSGVTAISTRVRVNSYTYVHAAAELSDGKTYVVKNYVKASGGCSAPASKDADEVAANTGALKFKQFSDPAGTRGKNARSPDHDPPSRIIPGCRWIRSRDTIFRRISWKS